jgi:hypothetical protein
MRQRKESDKPVREIQGSPMIDMKRIIDSVILELKDWAHWMRKDTESRHLGYPSKSPGMQSGYVSMTFTEMCESSDIQRVLIINSLVNDLISAQKAAISHKYLGTTIRFPRNNYANLLAEAHIEIYSGMKRKGLYIV